MTNPKAPEVPPESEPGGEANRGGVGPDPDEPNPFGPDAPNIREGDPPGGQVAPEAPPPAPPSAPLDDSDFAPDEA